MKSSKRSYHQFCGVAKALDVVGERWTLLIVRNLLVGGQRYKDLIETLPGITTNLLATRLREMSEHGLIAQRSLPPPANAVVYELTPLGRELEPVVLALGQFGKRYLGQPKRGDRTHVRWAMVSLKRRYLGSKRHITVAIDIDGKHAYRFKTGSTALEVESGPAHASDHARVSLAGEALRGLLFEGASARSLVKRGAIQIEGDLDAFYNLVRAVGATA